ncbi:MAG: hypothetical protein HYR75_01395 [Gemmatimonadetes bacterium]|nr:hypothetical protein [Gemmatimonadota bacterium]MBI3567683.1 hypothetical protein [Gemmatimonadota bacterium]
MPKLPDVRAAAAARSAFAALALCVLAATLSAQTAPGAPTGPAAPLSPFASQRIIVVPVQMLRGDSASWVTAPQWERFRRELDDSIGAALSDRGIGRRWEYASGVVRQSKLNSLYVGDPYAVGAQPLRGQAYKVNDRMPDMMSQNLRTIVALGDARYALVPVELVFERNGARQRAVLRLALVDARTTTFMWVADAVSDGAATMPAGLAGILGQRVADFVVPRP